MKKVRETLASLLVILVLFGAGFGAGFAVRYWQTVKRHAAATTIAAAANDLRLPREAEQYVVTSSEIRAALDEIREFATCSSIYEVSKTADVWRSVDDVALPGTRNTVAVRCQGVVKAGYDVDRITVAVDARSETVYIRLPQPEVLDNYVIMDTVDVSGSVNNILHPLSFDQYQQVIVSVEEEGLAQATQKGLFARAEESFRHIVTQCLAGVTDYRIVFL